MFISNLINNNYVAAIDDDGNEVVVNGIGIGYKKSKGSYIPDSEIQKVYRINNGRTIKQLRGLLQDIPEDRFQVCGEIIDFAQKKLRTELNPNLYVTLTDHVIEISADGAGEREAVEALIALVNSGFNEE